MTGFLASIRWQDVVDVLFNSYILFRLYVLFRGTTVLRVLIGIGTLWFLQRLAMSLGLVITSWAMQGITAAAALIIIVVFRHEIRLVLQAKNLRALLWGFGTRQSPSFIDPLVEGVFDLAERRIGALVVVPGRDDVSDSLRRGTRWDGTISREMLASIFSPGSPVHDGAAVVSGTRITEVGVLLPLSPRDDIPAHFGTRHRAALGLAESSDALVVVVSEERGAVTVAKEGRFITVRSRDRLRDLLAQQIGRRIFTAERDRRERLELGAAALVSLVLVLVLWLGFTRGVTTLITVETPIEYVNRKPELEIFSASANTVQLQLNGPGALLRSLRPADVQVKLDISRGSGGENLFALTEAAVSIPPGVMVRNITPPVIEVVLDRTVQKTVPLQAVLTGRLPDHVRVVGVRLAPDRLDLQGPSRELEDVQTLYTEPVVLEGIARDVKVQSGLAPDQPAARLVRDAGFRGSVSVTIDIAARETPARAP